MTNKNDHIVDVNKKVLGQIQKENRKAIIMACNPEAGSYEEALEAELMCFNKATGTIHPYREVWTDDRKLFRKMFKIIGKPLTLNRVLLALGSLRLSSYKNTLGLRQDLYEDWIDWDLFKETLEEQSEETQRGIHKLLCKQ